MKRYLFPQDYMADPSVHVFNGKIYIYPSHDYYSGIPEDDWGIHFDMKDYHVLSITGDPMTGEVKDEGVVELDEERKAAMVSNLMVVLCADESAQPVVNTGSLY